MKKQTLHIDEMSCQGCVEKIEKALKQKEEVKNVQVDLPTRKVEIDFDETRICLEELKTYLADIGYDTL